MTHACENSTLPHTLYAVGNKYERTCKEISVYQFIDSVQDPFLWNWTEVVMMHWRLCNR